MIVVRLEFKINRHHWQEAIEMNKRILKGPAWNQRGFRVASSFWSGEQFRLMVDLMYESLADWESAQSEAFDKIDPVDASRWNEICLETSVSYSKLEAEG
jgi:hypothetical protein